MLQLPPVSPSIIHAVVTVLRQLAGIGGMPCAFDWADSGLRKTALQSTLWEGLFQPTKHDHLAPSSNSHPSPTVAQLMALHKDASDQRSEQQPIQHQQVHQPHSFDQLGRQSTSTT